MPPTGEAMPQRFPWSMIPPVVALGLAIPAAIVPGDGASLLSLPLLTARSLLRMGLAYVLSLLFALFYGYFAATNRRAGTVMIPLLDILQSIPILGFMPAALIIFLGLFGPGNPLGPEVASIFLIFTSMSWNMAFGVFESVNEIPGDLREAADALGLTGRLRLRRLVIPGTIPRLVFNSILSWTNGWFFLVASEILFSSGTATQLPGLGSFLGQAAGLGGSLTINYADLAAGLSALVLTVLAIDIFIWRPLQVWSDRFKLEATAGPETTPARTPAFLRLRWFPTGYVRLRWLPTFPRIRRSFRWAFAPVATSYLKVSGRFEAFYHRHERAFRILSRVDLALFAIVVIWLTILGIQSVVQGLQQNPPPEIPSLPLALGLSTIRLAAAYLIALAWTIPAAYLAARSRRAQAVLTPLFEVTASVPAPAILPLLVGVILGLGGGANTMAVVVTLFSMQWYLLFNLLGAFRSIPGDLLEASEAFGLKGWLYWRRLLLPAIFPSLVTGSITAWGAGWNALIVSESIPYQGRTYEALGLGDLLVKATFIPEPVLIFLSVITMTAAVLVLNHFLWKPLYRLAAAHYRLD